MSTKVTVNGPPGCCLILMIFLIIGILTVLKTIWSLI